MPNESIKPKASEKITAILNKLEIPEAIEAWQQSGDDLHKRIEDREKELAEQKSKLPKKE